MDWNNLQEPFEEEYSKKRIIIIIVGIVTIVVLFLGALFFVEMRNESRSQNSSYQFVECDFSNFILTNAYLEGINEWKRDYPYTRYRQASHAKFMIFFSAYRPMLETIEYVRVTGPHGYRLKVDIMTPYNRVNLNGYVDNGSSLIFQACDVSGFIESGTYIIELKYKSGKKFSRIKQLESNYPILNQFISTPRQFSPIGKITANELCNDITLKWTILPSRNLFYCARLARHYKGINFTRLSDLLFFDNIFYAQAGVTGLNKNRVDVSLMLERNVLYVWMVEIVDSNEFHKINLLIYQKFQYFQIK